MKKCENSETILPFSCCPLVFLCFTFFHRFMCVGVHAVFQQLWGQWHYHSCTSKNLASAYRAEPSGRGSGSSQYADKGTHLGLSGAEWAVKGEQTCKQREQCLRALRCMVPEINVISGNILGPPYLQTLAKTVCSCVPRGMRRGFFVNFFPEVYLTTKFSAKCADC